MRKILIGIAAAAAVGLAAFYFFRPAANANEVTLYKNPQCGCCEEYAAYLRQNGFTVTVKPTHDLAMMSRQAGIPDDFQGWIRLANSYMVLQEPAKASDALRQALKLQPGNVGLLLQVAEIEIDAADGRVTPEAETMLRRALDRQPGNPQALWRLGHAAAARGETEEARRMWTELLPKLMEADPLKAEVRKALEAL